MKMVVPTLFGLEGIVADDLRWEGFSNVRADNGKVTFEGGFADIAKANLRIRCGERVLIQLGEFDAADFEELFQGVRALPWEHFIGRKDAFPVKGWSLNSQLHSVPDCQKIIKKAIVERLKDRYHIEWFEESAGTLQVQFSILKDRAALMLDTSGAGLHKRGYRKNANEAPIRETLAAGMVNLARVHRDSVVCDPFCGSGTIVIEAAMKALNIAPGLLRHFACEQWDSFPRDVFKEKRQEALSEIKKDARFLAYAWDIDEKALALTKQNAALAKVSGHIRAAKRDIREYRPDADRTITICNPPYGERLLEIRDAENLYRIMGEVIQPSAEHTCYVITPHEGFERLFGRGADKKRKLYNGMIKCNYYMYYRSQEKHAKSGAKK